MGNSVQQDENGPRSMLEQVQTVRAYLAQALDALSSLNTVNEWQLTPDEIKMFVAEATERIGKADRYFNTIEQAIMGNLEM